MLVLLRESFLVADWLDCGVVVVLVNLTVHSLGDILMAVSVKASVYALLSRTSCLWGITVSLVTAGLTTSSTSVR